MKTKILLFISFLTLSIGLNAQCFTPATNFPVNSPMSIIKADFNGDGKMDVATISYSNPPYMGDSVQISFGNGSGGFLSPISIFGLTDPSSITSGDFNGDGNVDLA